jgi:hypothetical protein
MWEYGSMGVWGGCGGMGVYGCGRTEVWKQSSHTPTLPSCPFFPSLLRIDKSSWFFDNLRQIFRAGEHEECR